MNRNFKNIMMCAGLFPMAIPKAAAQDNHTADNIRPNLLFIIADDMTWKHCNVYGCDELKTPNLSKMASEGIVFNNAYCSTPSSTASRSSVLTGRNSFELREGILLGGYLPTQYKVYPEYLEEAGYLTGCTGKGWGPGILVGRKHNPAGEMYRELRHHPYADLFSKIGISDIDYAANFNNFLFGCEIGQPFCFWVGIHEPHKGYTFGFAKTQGIDISNVTVPEFIPTTHETQQEVAEYYAEIQHIDREIGRIFDVLEKHGQLKNTLVIFTSDNGMPFARAKINLYEYGTHMPFIAWWGKNIKAGRQVEQPISLIDVAPTFLEAAGLEIPKQMSGESLLPILKNEETENADRAVYSCLERHGKGWRYPMRSIRKGDYILIWNADTDAHPNACDGGPSIDVVKANPVQYAIYYDLYYGKRPEFELYNVKEDPYCIVNLVNDRKLKKVRNAMKDELFAYLESHHDPRISGEYDEIIELIPNFNLYGDKGMYYSDEQQGQQIPYRRLESMIKKDYQNKGVPHAEIDAVLARLRENTGHSKKGE